MGSGRHFWSTCRGEKKEAINSMLEGLSFLDIKLFLLSVEISLTDFIIITDNKNHSTPYIVIPYHTIWTFNNLERETF